MSDEEIKKIKKEYQKGATYNEICNKFGITRNKLVYLKDKYKWKRKQSSRVKAAKENKNAVTTGEYESIYENVFSNEELIFFNNKDIDYSPREELIKTYKTLIIRKVRIMKRLQFIEQNDKELTIDLIKKKNDGNSTETETLAVTKDEKIIKFHDALTRVDKQILRVVEKLSVLPEDDKNKKKTTTILDDINRQLGLHGRTM